MKIFWSWQSDTPGKIGRHFVRKCLAAAIGRLKQDEDVLEPSEREQIHLDQDRQDVPGSPDLARTILEKIDQSDVFVADVTAVSTIPGNKAASRSQKRNMNPNVAIELGYALSKLSDQQLLMVLNVARGGIEFLPFDLRHKAGPITFSLKDDADAETIKTEEKNLIDRLVVALKPYIARGSKIGREPEGFVGQPSTTTSVAYWKPSEVLARVGDWDEARSVNCFLDDGYGAFLRVIPSSGSTKSFPLAELKERIQNRQLSTFSRNHLEYGPRVNAYGALVPYVAPYQDDPPIPPQHILHSTQVFQTGELWGVNQDHFHVRPEGLRVPFSPIQNAFRRTLPLYLRFVAEGLGISPPYQLRAGIVGMEGAAFLVASRHGGTEAMPTHRDEALFEAVMRDLDPQAIHTVLERLLDHVFDLTGERRPQTLRDATAM